MSIQVRHAAVGDGPAIVSLIQELARGAGEVSPVSSAYVA